MGINKRLFFTLALSSVFILTAAALRPERTMSEDYVYIMRYDKKPNCDVLVAGNSRVDCDLIPEIMSPICGKTYLFAMNAAKLTPDFMGKIPEKLNPEGKKIILLAISPSEFYMRKNNNNKHFCRIHNMTPFRRKAEMHVFQRFSVPDLDPTKIRHGDGYHELRYAPNPNAHNKELKNYRGFLPVPDAVIIGFADDVRNLVNEGYTVLGCRFPTCPEMKKVEDEKWDYSAFRRITADAGMIWIDIDGEYETVDASHMTPDSARRFSKKMAYKIKEIENSKAR